YSANYPCGAAAYVSPSEERANKIVAMYVEELDLLQADENPRPFQFRNRIASDSRLVTDRIKRSERDDAASRRENRQKQSREILPEPIVPALRIGAGFAALYGWGWLGWRSGDGRFSTWGWRFLSLA